MDTLFEKQDAMLRTTSMEIVQIADIPDSYILAGDIEMPRGNKLPLWMIGLLY